MSVTGTTWKGIENLVEASLRQYTVDGLAHAQRNWPEIMQQGYRAIVVGKAGPDWTVFSQGKAIQLEVKTWKGRDSHKFSFTGTRSKMRRRAQWQALQDAARDGGVGAFYLAAWRHDSFEGGMEWRLHDAMTIPYGGDYLQFRREDGLLVPTSPGGWPDWLGVAFDF